MSKLKVEGARSQQGAAAAVEEAQFARGTFVAQSASGLGKDELRQLADAHRDRIKTGVVVIGSVDDGRVSLVVAVTKDLVPKVHAGNIVKELAPVDWRARRRPARFRGSRRKSARPDASGARAGPEAGRKRVGLKSLHSSADTSNRQVHVAMGCCSPK